MLEPIFPATRPRPRPEDKYPELELERVPDLARRSGPEEKLALGKLNTQYYPSSIFLETRWGSIHKTWIKMISCVASL